MKETTIAFVTFFMMIVLVLQIKTIKYLRKIKRIKENTTDYVLYDASVCSVIADTISCFKQKTSDEKETDKDIISAEELDKRSKEKLYRKALIAEEEREKELERKEWEKRREKESMDKKVEGYIIKEKEETKIKEIVSNKTKTSLFFISNITTIPREGVIEIIAKDSNYTIENDYVINKRLIQQTKQSEEWQRRKEKIAQGICPECNNLINPELTYCPNCGCELTRE